MQQLSREYSWAGGPHLLGLRAPLKAPTRVLQPTREASAAATRPHRQGPRPPVALPPASATSPTASVAPTYDDRRVGPPAHTRPRPAPAPFSAPFPAPFPAPAPSRAPTPAAPPVRGPRQSSPFGAGAGRGRGRGSVSESGAHRQGLHCLLRTRTSGSPQPPLLGRRRLPGSQGHLAEVPGAPLRGRQGHRRADQRGGCPRPTDDSNQPLGRGVLSMHGLTYGVIHLDSEEKLSVLIMQDVGLVMPGGQRLGWRLTAPAL
ncbi:uncharacterized protein LOC144334776 [Macaca mulatta]